ncbi:multidrug MFS transporter [Salipiger aestuarii]|uniref:Bcr/CflA family efflux transporter n=1 Tax=Salipiger aestuarii TaxID=568098 RepID=A0A327Y0H5_9RHOB|nr:multidrug effflux MFS transporter [Salipiger aestuarii]KAB2541301.1 multidrug MFS transporter [Salipiger aestuarii]RAK13927.1 DHA1 family bicyclomycin/chloramphenicol resistance-like MFS transporter [Salipiger aestuarii]
MQNVPTVRFLDRTTPPHIATLILLAGLSALAMNVFLPSLPKMVAHFDTQYRLMQLSVAIYLAVNAVLQVLIGPVSDKFGRRPVILWGVGLFCVATVGCIFAPNVTLFLTFRMCQAVVVTAMVLSRAAVRDVVPQDQAASMIGYVTMGVAVVPMIGPVIGGMLDEAFGWQSTFWLLLILGGAIFWLTWCDLGETSAPRGLSLGQQFRKYPELLASPRFWGYALTCALASGGFFAYLGGAPFVGTAVFGLTPTVLGFFFGLPAIGYFIGNGLSGKFSARIGVNLMILWGCLTNTAGLALALILFLSGLQSEWTFFGCMTFMGLGNGMTIPNATAGALSVRPHLAGTASGLSGAIMIGGGAGLSALAGGLLQPGTGAWPLLWLMLATGVASIMSIALVFHRERKLRGY